MQLLWEYPAPSQVASHAIQSRLSSATNCLSRPLSSYSCLTCRTCPLPDQDTVCSGGKRSARRFQLCGLPPLPVPTPQPVLRFQRSAPRRSASSSCQNLRPDPDRRRNSPYRSDRWNLPDRLANQRVGTFPQMQYCADPLTVASWFSESNVLSAKNRLLRLREAGK